VVAELTARLRKDAPPPATGPLARMPQDIRADGLAAMARTISDAKPADLFATIRFRGSGAFGNVTGMVWKTEKSRLLIERKPNGFKYVGDILALEGPYYDQQAVGEALLLHAALRAKSQGHAGFVISATRPSVRMVLVRYGEPGQAGFPASIAFPAEQVIADLSPLMPNPAAPKS
jgi:hypothetical protein